MADSVPGASPSPSPSSTTPATTDPRWQLLAGVEVNGADGARVGRVRDVYLHDRSGDLAAVSVTRRHFSSRSILLPAAALAASTAELAAQLTPSAEHGPELHLRLAGAVARAGIRPPAVGHADPATLQEAARVLGLEEAAAG